MNFSDAEILALGRKVLASQPFCQLLGIELDEMRPGFAAMSMPLKEAYTQHHGTAHGGVVGTLADTVLAYAGATKLLDVVSVEYKINFLKPGYGERLVAEASVLSASTKQAVTEAKIYTVNAGEKELIAVAQGTIRKTN